MELATACLMIWQVLANQSLKVQEHQQVQAAFHQIAPKCQPEMEKAQKEAAKRAK